MGLTRSWFSANKKIFIGIGCGIALLVAIFFIGRGFGSSSNIGDDITAEIRQSITNIEQITRDQSTALGILGSQYERIEENLGRIEGIELGIESIARSSHTIETLVGGLLAGEQRDRDLIIESAILVDRNERLIDNIRSESNKTTGSP